MPPPNDNFSAAQVLSGNSGSVTGTNVDATMETGEPFAAGAGEASIWYRWTAPAAMQIRFSTEGSNFDTVLAVYTGTGIDDLVLIASNDDAVGQQSQVSITATAATTYFVTVAGYLGETGDVVLSWTEIAPPGDIVADDGLTELVAGAPLSVSEGDSFGYLDGTGTDARFGGCTQLVVWHGDLYTVDGGLGVDGGQAPIRRITTDGVVSTFATVTVEPPSEFTFTTTFASGICAGDGDNLWVATYGQSDSGGDAVFHKLHEIDANGAETVLWTERGNVGTWAGSGSGMVHDPLRGGAWTVGVFTNYLFRITSSGRSIFLQFPHLTSPHIRFPSDVAITADGRIFTAFAQQMDLDTEVVQGLWEADYDTADTHFAGYTKGQPAGVVDDGAGNIWVLGAARTLEDGSQYPAGWYRIPLNGDPILLYPWTHDMWDFNSGVMHEGYLYWTLQNRVFRHPVQVSEEPWVLVRIRSHVRVHPAWVSPRVLTSTARALA